MKTTYSTATELVTDPKIRRIFHRTNVRNVLIANSDGIARLRLFNLSVSRSKK